MLPFFGEHLHAKNQRYWRIPTVDINDQKSCNLVEWEQFWPIICETEFSQIWNFHRQTGKCKDFHFRLLPTKSNTKIIKKQQSFILGTFFPVLETWLFSVSRFLSLCETSEKTDARMERPMKKHEFMDLPYSGSKKFW